MDGDERENGAGNVAGGQFLVEDDLPCGGPPAARLGRPVRHRVPIHPQPLEPGPLEADELLRAGTGQGRPPAGGHVL